MNYKCQVVCELILATVLNIFSFDTCIFIFICDLINDIV